MKNLNNIGKPVPEASDPALIKPVSDAIEAVDSALGASTSTLTTDAKTLVPAINELDANISLQNSELGLARYSSFFPVSNAASLLDVVDGMMTAMASNGWTNWVGHFRALTHPDVPSSAHYGFGTAYVNGSEALVTIIPCQAANPMVRALKSGGNWGAFG